MFVQLYSIWTPTAFIDIQDRYWSLFWYIFMVQLQIIFVNHTLCIEKRNFLTISTCATTTLNTHSTNCLQLQSQYACSVTVTKRVWECIHEYFRDLTSTARVPLPFMVDVLQTVFYYKMHACILCAHLCYAYSCFAVLCFLFSCFQYKGDTWAVTYAYSCCNHEYVHA